MSTARIEVHSSEGDVEVSERHDISSFNRDYNVAHIERLLAAATSKVRRAYGIVEKESA